MKYICDIKWKLDRLSDVVQVENKQELLIYVKEISQKNNVYMIGVTDCNRNPISKDLKSEIEKILGHSINK